MTEFERPGLSADAVVLCGRGDDMRLLVIERGRDPYRGRSALPGGFVEKDELLREAVVRELREETGLSLPAAAGLPLTLRAAKGRDPRGWTVSLPYLFWLPQPESVAGGDDATRADWVALRDIGELAFDHGAMLCEALGRFWAGMPGSEPFLARATHAYGVPAPEDECPVFFGGTFAPWHDGHRAVIETCPARQRVVVVPDYNPFKGALQVPCAFARYRALRMAIKDMGVSVYPGFCGREDPNPTYFWLRQLNRRASLLVGADSLMAIHTWAESTALLGLIDELFIAQRGVDHAAMRAQVEALLRKTPSLKVHLQANHAHELVSSTALRSKK